jgi:hypothetical protein
MTQIDVLAAVLDESLARTAMPASVSPWPK